MNANNREFRFLRSGSGSRHFGQRSALLESSVPHVLQERIEIKLPWIVAQGCKYQGVPPGASSIGGELCLRAVPRRGVL